MPGPTLYCQGRLCTTRADFILPGQPQPQPAATLYCQGRLCTARSDSYYLSRLRSTSPDLRARADYVLPRLTLEYSAEGGWVSASWWVVHAMCAMMGSVWLEWCVAGVRWQGGVVAGVCCSFQGCWPDLCAGSQCLPSDSSRWGISYPATPLTPPAWQS